MRRATSIVTRIAIGKGCVLVIVGSPLALHEADRASVLSTTTSALSALSARADEVARQQVGDGRAAQKAD